MTSKLVLFDQMYANKIEMSLAISGLEGVYICRWDPCRSKPVEHQH